MAFIMDENAVESINGMTYEFPYTMHECDLTDFVVPWHWHEELEFNYAYQGTIMIETLNCTYTIQQGEAYFINTNVMNTKRKGESSTSAMEHAHLFHPVLLTGHFRSIFQTKYLNPVLQNQSIEVMIIKEDTKSGKEFLRLLHKLTELHRQKDQEFEIRSILGKAWMVLMEEIAVQQTRKNAPAFYKQERLKSMLNYLHTNYARRLTLSDLAKHVGISEKECIRSFKALFHQTPIEYLVEYRIEQAKRLLRETDESITNIAFMTGFNNCTYFGKTFRKITQMTPKEYRQNK